MKVFVYYLRCPLTNEVKYVGATKNPKARYQQHINKLDRLLTKKRVWIEGLRARGTTPILEIVEECEGAEAGREREQYHVTLHQGTTLNIHNPAKGAKSNNGAYPTRYGKKN